MGRIQTTIGLMSGLPIADTVDKLMAIARRPRDLLAGQNQVFEKQRAAVIELSALLASVQFAAKNLAKSDLYNRRTAQSSNPQAVEVRVTGSPALGTTVVRPLRLASQHQLVSSGLANPTSDLGGGEITWRFGPDLARPLPLAYLQGGNGFVPGVIRLTDRAGGTATVDLSAAQTIEDVLRLINTQTGIRIRASIDGDRIRLEDLSGGSGRLTVDEVTPGTARSLGLHLVNTSGDVAFGEEIVFLSEKTPLMALNDGRGIRSKRYLPEIRYELRDGTQGTITLSGLLGQNASPEGLTLGQLLDYVNGVAPGKLRLEIAADGKRLVLRDLTSGAGSTVVAAIGDSHLLADLGLDLPSVDGVITGRRIIGGLDTVLVTSVNGGKGLGPLGQIRIQDGSGAEAYVDLAGSETLAEILAKINASGISVVAELNPWRTGIRIRDISGQSTNPFVIESVDDTRTAEKLGIATAGTDRQVDSGDLHMQVISENTRLSDLGGGRGVAAGSFAIVDSRGNRRTIVVSPSAMRTVGDVLRAINSAGLAVRAEINPTGDGIRLVDQGGGDRTLQVLPVVGTTAKDLGLLRPSQAGILGGQPAQWVDGSFTYRVELAPGESLQTLVARINAADGGIVASLLSDGSATPWRLVLQSIQPGSQARVVITGTTLPLTFSQLAPAQDALLALGGGSSVGAQVVLASPNNKFTQVIPGVELTVKQLVADPVSISVGASEADVVASVKLLVDSYNRFRSKLAEHTSFDQATGAKGPLFGDIVALRLQTEIPRLLSSGYRAAGKVASLRELGVELAEDGSLKLDESRLRQAFQEDPEAVARFFADNQVGFGKKLDQLLEQLAGVDKSLLAQRLEGLSRKIDWNTRRMEQWDERLRIQRERLLAEFYRLDRVIGQMQSQLAVVERLNNMAGSIVQVNRR